MRNRTASRERDPVSASLVATLFAILSLLLTNGCFQPDPTEDPAALVREMYTALSESDQDRYMDTIHPDNRKTPDLTQLFKALSIGYQAGGVGVNLGGSSLFEVSIREVDVTIVKREVSSYALVQAQGLVRYPLLGMELRFCDQHDVVYSGDRWYVDVENSRRKERLKKVLAIRQQELLQKQHVSQADSIEESLSNLFEMVGPGIETMLDLCLPDYG